jgi:hypothetical protein
MEVFALSLVAGIAIILGSVILVALTFALLFGGALHVHQKTRGGTGTRTQQPPDRVGRVWKLWREHERERQSHS